MKFDFIQSGQWSPNLNTKHGEIDGGHKITIFPRPFIPLPEAPPLMIPQLQLQLLVHH